MEELKTLKELFDAGFMSQSEFDKRRIEIVNRITGSSYASAGGSPTPAASTSASVDTPVATRPPAAVVQSTRPPAAGVQSRAPAPVDDAAVLLGELDLDDAALWDELDALASVGASTATSASTLQPATAFATMRPPSSVRQPAAVSGGSSTLRQAAEFSQPSTLSQPTSYQPGTLASATMRQPAAFAQPQMACNTLRPMSMAPGTLRQPAAFQPTPQAQMMSNQPQAQMRPMSMVLPDGMMQAGSMQMQPMSTSGGSLSTSGSGMSQYDVPANQTPSEFRGAPSLQSQAMASRTSAKTAMMDMVGGGSRASKDSATPYTWEFFHAAQNNNVKKLSELLGMGVDVNQRDTDTSNSALHLAATRGQKHAIYFLVDQGADIDAQNRKGSTPLHLLVTNRFNNLAVWMVKQGADINIEDLRGFTPFDMALPWLQKEMKEAMYGRTRTAKTQQQINRVFGELSTDLHPEVLKESNFQKAQALGISMDTMSGGAPRSASQPNAAGVSQIELDLMRGSSDPVPHTAAAPADKEVMKIYLKNGAYKSLLITNTTKVGDVCTMMAGKLNLEAHATSFDLVDVQRDKTRRLDPGGNVLKLKSQWPLILGKKGNETEKYCRFIVVPKRGTSEVVQKLYRKAMHK